MSLLALVIGAACVALGMLSTSVASADTIFNPPSIPFSDSRSDFSASRPGTVVEGRYGPFVP